MQSYGGNELDASLLLMPLVGFLPPDDPRVVGTVAAIERELMVDGFVLRYDTARADDGLPPGEGAFLACSFWLADTYVLLGRARRGARAVRAAARRCATTSACWREEYDPRVGRAARQLPAGVLARRAGQHRVQPDARDEAGRAARRSLGGGHIEFTPTARGTAATGAGRRRRLLSRRRRMIGALLGGLRGAGQIERAVDQRHVRERLREIAEQLA